MRQLKFRAWDGEKTMWYWHQTIITFGPNGTWSVYLNKENGGHFCCDSTNKKAILTQYTGLTDKNDVEIYEGDILQKDGSLGFVRFDYGWAVEFSKEYSHDMPQSYCSHLEVIGDLYRNPELIDIEIYNHYFNSLDHEEKLEYVKVAKQMFGKTNVFSEHGEPIYFNEDLSINPIHQFVLDRMTINKYSN